MAKKKANIDPKKKENACKAVLALSEKQDISVLEASRRIAPKFGMKVNTLNIYAGKMKNGTLKTSSEKSGGFSPEAMKALEERIIARTVEELIKRLKQ